MLEHEKGYKEKEAGFPSGAGAVKGAFHCPVNRWGNGWGFQRASGAATGFRS